MSRKLLAMKPLRFDTIDSLRGLAIVWMTVFHFCFDLNEISSLSTLVGWTHQRFQGEPFWTLQRTAIVTLFLLCAGLSQAVAVRQQQSVQRFFRRWSQVALSALLVSAGSFVMYPKSFIYFGVLHGIAVMLLIARFTAAWGRWLWLAGALVFAAHLLAAQAVNALSMADVFNSPALNWLGLITRKPVTEDYVPLVPWLGVVWWGMAAGQWLLTHRPQWLCRPTPRAAAPLSWMGRWSLSWYMLHQPVMIGVLTAAAAMLPPA